jgi:hypothetical protein
VGLIRGGNSFSNQDMIIPLFLAAAAHERCQTREVVTQPTC